MSRDTVRSEISNPSFFSSPCTRGAPQVGLADAMVWTSFRISERIRGRPGCLGWDNFHQYRLKRSRCQDVTVSGCTILNADFSPAKSYTGRSKIIDLPRSILAAERCA